MGDPIEWAKWGRCNHPQMDIDKNDSLIDAGADDEYGSYFFPTPDFGCILFERRAGKARKGRIMGFIIRGIVLGLIITVFYWLGFIDGVRL